MNGQFDSTLLYCDHGFPVGGDCWRCWQRKALDYQAMIRELVAVLEESKIGVRKWAVMPEELVEDVLTRAQRLLGPRE